MTRFDLSFIVFITLLCFAMSLFLTTIMTYNLFNSIEFPDVVALQDELEFWKKETELYKCWWSDCNTVADWLARERIALHEVYWDCMTLLEAYKYQDFKDIQNERLKWRYVQP